jgi:outer membrane lipoprotein
MKRNRWGLMFMIAMLVTGCAVMPPAIQPAADLQDIPFRELIRQASQYMGETVILGGYVLSVENQVNQTLLTALQAPLGVGQKPRSRDLSQGRLILVREGFLDPEVFEKDRRITIGGTIVGSSATEKEETPYPYLRVRVEEIHLWPRETGRIADPYHYWRDPYWGDPFWRPYPWYWRYPYRWR